MKDLGNIFSVLSLDVGDDKDQTTVGAPTDARKQSGKKNPVKVQISEAHEECPPAEGSSERFRSPLVWIDLEMTKYRKAPRKEKKHRAMDDIKESIMELKYFKQNIFKGSKK